MVMKGYMESELNSDSTVTSESGVGTPKKTNWMNIRPITRLMEEVGETCLCEKWESPPHIQA
jgi:hypothetical protein